MTSYQEAKSVMQNARCLYSQAALDEALNTMAANITKAIGDDNPLVLTVMNGGLICAGQLLTRLNFPLQMDYIHATRYRDTCEGNDLDWIAKPRYPLKDRVVLIIDDILDEGVTLQSILRYCETMGARKVLSCVLAEKKHDRKHGCAHADFIGVEVEDVYVFGYGMDYHSYLRNMPGIYTLGD